MWGQWKSSPRLQRVHCMNVTYFSTPLRSMFFIVALSVALRNDLFRHNISDRYSWNPSIGTTTGFICVPFSQLLGFGKSINDPMSSRYKHTLDICLNLSFSPHLSRCDLHSLSSSIISQLLSPYMHPVLDSYVGLTTPPPQRDKTLKSPPD